MGRPWAAGKGRMGATDQRCIFQRRRSIVLEAAVLAVVLVESYEVAVAVGPGYVNPRKTLTVGPGHRSGGVG